MVYITVIITHILQITNQAGPSVWAVIHVLHFGHFSRMQLLAYQPYARAPNTYWNYILVFKFE